MYVLDPNFQTLSAIEGIILAYIQLPVLKPSAL